MKRLLAFFAALMAFVGLALGAVNVNTATQSELEALHGIGPVKAKAIIQYREKNGPFRTLEDLDKVPGIGKATLEKMRPDVTLTGASSGVAHEKAMPGAAEEMKAQSKPEPPTAAKGEIKRAPHEAAAAPSKPEAKPEPKAAAKKDVKATAAEKKKEEAAKKKEEAAKKKVESKKEASKPAKEIDINSASAKELAKLPGIGDTRAKAIVKGRPYGGKDDLVQKKVLPQSAYDGIKDMIVAKQKKKK
jgi:competence protein ComEA